MLKSKKADTTDRHEEQVDKCVRERVRERERERVRE